MFDDTFLHAVINRTPEERVVMWLDIMRTDLPWRQSLINRCLVKLVPLIAPELPQILVDQDTRLGLL